MITVMILYASVILNLILVILLWQKNTHMKIDPLTKIFNIRAFQRSFKRMKYSKRLSIAILDIDLFKKVNDTYGHIVGDGVLEALAQRLKKAVRKSDIVARYGGEEFVIILPYCDSDEAFQILERIRVNIDENPFHIRETEIHITISGGISTHPQIPYDRLLELADAALYRAKREGRNKVVISSGVEGDEG